MCLFNPVYETGSINISILQMRKQRLHGNTNKLGNCSFLEKVSNRPWLMGLSWLEHGPVDQRIAGSIPSQGTCLSCEFSPGSGHIWEATNPCFSLSHWCSPPTPCSLKSISMSSGEDQKKRNKQSTCLICWLPNTAGKCSQHVFSFDPHNDTAR